MTRTALARFPTMTLVPVFNVLLACAATMALGWLIERRLHNAGIADLLWAACIGASAVYYGRVAPGSMFSQMLVIGLGGLWAFRSVMYLLRRMLAEHEDARYRRLRQRADGCTALFAALFGYRALSAALFSATLFAAASNPADTPGAWTLIGAAVYAVGLLGELCADAQLAAFRAQPRNFGRSCRSGLWRYSRHPNYFFEAVHWCAYAFLAVGTPWPLWPLALCAPLLTALEWLVIVPMAEAQALRARGEDYRAYCAATSRLLPWFPRGGPERDVQTPAVPAGSLSLRSTPRRPTPPVVALRTPVGSYAAPAPPANEGAGARPLTAGARVPDSP